MLYIYKYISSFLNRLLKRDRESQFFVRSLQMPLNLSIKICLKRNVWSSCTGIWINTPEGIYVCHFYCVIILYLFLIHGSSTLNSFFSFLFSFSFSQQSHKCVAPPRESSCICINTNRFLLLSTNPGLRVWWFFRMSVFWVSCLIFIKNQVIGVLYAW